MNRPMSSRSGPSTPTRHQPGSPLIGSAGSTMTVELELSSSESPSDFETTAEDLQILSASYTTAGSLSPQTPHLLLSSDQPLSPLQDLQLDMQGIPWARANTSREQFRANRIAAYLQYEQDRGYQTAMNVELFDDSAAFYGFRYMNRFEGCTVQHFQLKHLIHCPDPLALYFPLYNRIKRLQPQRLDIPSQTMVNLTESFGAGFSRISSFIAVADIGLIGGLFGELIVWRTLDDHNPSPPHFQIISPDPTNSVVNHISRQDGHLFTISCNDGYLRIFDAQATQIITEVKSHWPVNATNAHPAYPSLIAVVGDGPDVLLCDSREPKFIAKLSGHDDCSFSLAWRPDGLHLATASQDRTVIVRDIRMFRKQLARRRTFMSVPRSLKYHPDGDLLVVATADDYVHIVDSKTYDYGQVIDFFGDIAGVDFGVGCGEDRLFIGCANPHQGGIICFDRMAHHIFR
jgi:hypothetical protein